MAVEAVRWAGPNTENKPSGTIWGKCPWNAINEGSVKGVTFFDDFHSFNITPPTTEGNWTGGQGYTVFTSTGGVIIPQALSAATGAGLPSSGISIGSDADGEAVVIRSLATPFAINRANQRLWFEACIKKSSIADTIAEVFIGLQDNTAGSATSPITNTAATLADVNIVGIYSTESAGSLGNSTYKANGVTAVTVGSGEFSFVADTYTNVGMMFVPSGDKDGAYVLSFYQDGVRLSSSKVIPTGNGDDFPNDVALGPIMAIRQAAAGTPRFTVKWWKCAQLMAPLN